jgi:hypothetical protein
VAAIAALDRTVQPDLFGVIELKESDLRGIYPGLRRDKGLSTELRNEARKLMSLMAETSEAPKTWKMVNVIKSCEYTARHSLLITFHEDMVQNLLHLKADFTRYQINAIARLPNAGSMHLYEVLRSWMYIGAVRYTVREMRDLLSIEKGAYTVQHDFKKRVLDPFSQAINKCTDIEVAFKPYREGKAVAGYDWTVRSRSDDAPLSPFARAVAALMIDFGLSEALARESVALYGPQDCARKLLFARIQRAKNAIKKNPPGFLSTLLRSDSVPVIEKQDDTKLPIKGFVTDLTWRIYHQLPDGEKSVLKAAFIESEADQRLVPIINACGIEHHAVKAPVQEFLYRRFLHDRDFGFQGLI